MTLAELYRAYNRSRRNEDRAVQVYRAGDMSHEAYMCVVELRQEAGTALHMACMDADIRLAAMAVAK